MAGPSGLGIHQLRKVLVRRLVAGASCLLNAADRVRIPRVFLAGSTPGVEPLIGKFGRNAV